ncbi:MAG: acyltransferase family protein [Flavobacteriaceae bacterium]
MNPRLHFLDALRALAILMMLQGHFISGLLDPAGIDTSHWGYRLWLYCRGFTAPVFFTVTGWVFSYLLFRNPQQGSTNPRIRKGIWRAMELLMWGYLLRLNLFSLLGGSVNPAFWQPDVLHVIALGLVCLLGMYFTLGYHKLSFGMTNGLLCVLLFVTEPMYSGQVFQSLPTPVAAYLTQANGGVFYLFPWLGYVFLGASLATLIDFDSPVKRRYFSVIAPLVGILIVTQSSAFLMLAYRLFELPLLKDIAYNNYLFIRLGDVLILVGFFVLVSPWLRSKWWLRIGSKTLSIYIVHYFILYGSWTGFGLYKEYAKSGSIYEVLVGVVLFVFCCVALVAIHPHIMLWIREKYKQWLPLHM